MSVDGSGHALGASGLRLILSHNDLEERNGEESCREEGARQEGRQEGREEALRPCGALGVPAWCDTPRFLGCHPPVRSWRLAARGSGTRGESRRATGPRASPAIPIEGGDKGHGKEGSEAREEEGWQEALAGRRREKGGDCRPLFAHPPYGAIPVPSHTRTSSIVSHCRSFSRTSIPSSTRPNAG